LAEKTGGPSTANTNRACFDRRSREDKCGNGIPKSAGKIYASAGPTCHGGR